MNQKQAKFCQEYVIDSNGAQAAIRAGYSPKTAREQASRLLTKVHVRKRIEELHAQSQKRMEVTVDSLTQFLLDDRTLAHANKQAGAAVSATEKLAKLHGLLSDRLKIDMRLAPADLTDAEIDAELEQIRREFAELEINHNGRAGIVARITEWENVLAQYDRGEFDQPADAAPLTLPAPVSPLP